MSDETKGNGWMTLETAKVILTIAQAILLAMLTGVGALILKQRETLIELKAQMMTLENSTIYRLDRVENLIDLHIRNHIGGSE